MTDLMAKADRAVASAELLLAANDLDGACNRAYYAMFDAAKVALIADKAPVHAEEIRSHSGLIAAFSLHFVKPGRVPIELGRAFNKAEELRIVADYRGDSVDTERVTWVVQQAGEFVRFVRSAFFSEGD